LRGSNLQQEFRESLELVRNNNRLLRLSFRRSTQTSALGTIKKEESGDAGAGAGGATINGIKNPSLRGLTILHRQ
jgi:hypothetical protein